MIARPAKVAATAHAIGTRDVGQRPQRDREPDDQEHECRGQEGDELPDRVERLLGLAESPRRRP